MTSDRQLRVDARRNRQRVLEAAEEVFASEGMAVPIDEIARRAGVGPGTVYRHFPSKESLFQAIVVSRIERLTDEARTLAGAGDPGQAFFGFLQRMVEDAGSKRDLMDALTDAGIDISGSLTAGYKEAVGRLLARAQDAGAVRRDARIEDLIALLLGASMAVRRHRDDPEVLVRVMRIVSDGLRAGR